MLKAALVGRSYPLVVYLLHGGLWIYQPKEHALTLHKREDLRKTLAEDVLTQMNREAIEEAPLTVVVASDNKSIVELTPRVEDALCFTYLEAGHATQNLILQAWALGLGACTITSYKTVKAQRLLTLPLHHQPIYLIPLGISNNHTSASNEL
jgi:SagB-type dehydrogenase family enzyme